MTPLARSGRLPRRSRPRARWPAQGFLGLGLVLALVGVSLLAPLLAPHNPATLFANGLTAAGAPRPPSARFPLGTDQYGRDELSRLLYGGRLTLLVAGTAALLATLLGTLVGVASGYLSGFWSEALGRLTDIVMSLPVTLLAIAMVMVATPSVGSLIAVITFVSWAYTARLIRAEVLVIREAPFIEAAHAMAARPLRVMGTHVWPQVARTALVRFTLMVSQVILLASGLSFLGAGIQAPAVDWGLMIAQGESYYGTDPALMLWPGLAIFLTVVGFNLVGEALADRLGGRRSAGVGF